MGIYYYSRGFSRLFCGFVVTKIFLLFADAKVQNHTHAHRPSQASLHQPSL
jgi:hypothetical protein